MDNSSRREVTYVSHYNNLLDFGYGCPTTHSGRRSSHRRCSVKRGVLKISRDSQENTSVGASFQ